MPVHWLNIYEKPAQGNSFLKRYPSINYRHKISHIGWFDTASCDLIVTADDGERFLEQMLGNRVAVFVDNPAEPIWEGFINRITFEYGPVVYTVSLDEMANRVRVTWNNPDATPPQRVSADADDTDSQAQYGIKTMILDGNVNYTVDGSGRHPRVLRDTQLSLRAWPLASAAYRGGASQTPRLRIEMRGFYATLDWSVYREDVDLDVALSTLMATVISGNVNGDTFLEASDTSRIDTNAVEMNQKNLSNLGVWQFATQMVEAGDDTTILKRRWTMGITPTDPNTGKRYFYYRRSTDEITYSTRLRDQVGAIRSQFNRPVSPWRVVPDRGILISDALPGWALMGDDPRVVYLETVDYDGERGLVSFASSDDITVEGVFRLRKMHRPTNLRFGIVRASY